MKELLNEMKVDIIRGQGGSLKQLPVLLTPPDSM